MKILRKRKIKETGRAQVRFEKHSETLAGDLGDIKANKARAEELRRKALGEN